MQEQTIFIEALEKEDPAERAAFLDRVCAGDPALRQRIEKLLHRHQQSGSFLGKPVPEQLAEGLAAGPEARDTPTRPAAADGDAGLDFLEPSGKPGVLGRLGHYEVHEVIGRGGMGIVLKAFDEQLHRVVAIKVLAPQLATGATARKRFVREAQAAAAVRDEHVIDIHAVEEADPLPYLVMEYIAGVSLQERLDRSGPLQVKEILRIGMQAAAGLAAAHAQGLVHRDIKPANILLENGVERVKITDFGLARAVDDAGLTQSGMVAGTPQYMSPEQAEARLVDSRSDLFSLGSVLYALCTGRPPFRADSAMAVLKRVCEDVPRPIPEINSEVPPWLVEIIARLHAKDPAARIQSAAEVAELLGQRLAELQQSPVGPTLPRPARRQPRRRWPKAVAALVVLAAGLGLTEATGVTRLVPALLRAVHGPANDEEKPAGGDLKRDGAFGFPQAQAQVLCDNADLRLSFWNDSTFLYLQTVLWKDDDDTLGQSADGRPFCDQSCVIFDLDTDGQITPQVDRIYTLNPFPRQGLRYQVYNGFQKYTVLQDTTGCGGIRYLPMADGSRVRVDSLVVPLAEINKRPGDKLRLAYWGRSPKPDLTLNSVGYQNRRDYAHDRLPWHKFHEVILADRADVLDLRAVPDDHENLSVLPQAETHPFVLLARGGRAEQKLDTLADAVRLAWDGDTIEVRANGPFLQGPVSIDHAVRIRAGEGFRPAFRVSPAEQPGVGELITSFAPLVLEGLEFHQTGPGPKPGTNRGSLISCVQAPLHVANCRFGARVALSSAPLVSERASRCEVRNCQLIGTTGFSLIYTPRNRTVLRNNLIVARGTSLFLQSNAFAQSPAPAEAVVQLTRNTLVGMIPMNCITVLDPKASSDPVAGGARGLRVEASGNIFHGQTAVLQMQVLQGAERSAELLPRQTSWKGDHNLFAADAFLTFWDGKERRVLVDARLTEWTQFWGDPETGSIEGRRPRYYGGDFRDLAEIVPEQVTPAEFRLHPESAGRGAGPDGQDLGADVGLVGPGPAYERWKKTPDYLEWLKITGLVMESGKGQPAAVAPVPQVEAHPFVILAREGRAEQKLGTLAEAVRSARDGDTIEVRGNGPFTQQGPISISDHAVRIRAGDGFRPVFHVSPAEQPGADEFIASFSPLVLEGLEFHQTGPDGKQGTSRGSIIRCVQAPLYVANCRCVTRVRFNNDALVADKSSRCEVRNCQLIGLYSFGLHSTPRSRTVLRNNLMVTTGTSLFLRQFNDLVPSNAPGEAVVQLTRNTLVGRFPINCITVLEPKASPDPGAPEAKGLRIEASGNIFHGQPAVLQVQGAPQGIEVRADLVQRQIHWKGDHNLFSADAFLSSWNGKERQVLVDARLMEWTQFWGSPETGSLESRHLRYLGDVRAMVVVTPEQLTPENLRLHTESAGRRAGTGGQDLGADVDLVGPGPAYERWKKTPDYQEWLKVTGQTK
jgi:hypothetical protein